MGIIYMGIRADRPPKKKLKKIKIPPCVSERLMVDYAALRPQQVQRSNFENHKLQGKITGCAGLRVDARRNNATACDIGSRGREMQYAGRAFTDSPGVE